MAMGHGLWENEMAGGDAAAQQRYKRERGYKLVRAFAAREHW